MAIRREPLDTKKTQQLPPAVLDRQSVRDLLQAFEKYRGGSRDPNRPTHIRVNNEYDVDDVDDILGFERPITSLQLMSNDFLVHVTFTPRVAILSYDTTQGGQVALAVDIRALADRSRVRGPSIWLPLLAALLASVAAGVGAPKLVEHFSRSEGPAWSGYLAQAVVLTVWAYIVYRIRRWTPDAVLQGAQAVQPWHRRHESAISLTLALLSLIATVVTIFTG